MPYSKRHYRLVSPPADTAADIADRLKANAARAQAAAEMREKFPVFTTDNLEAADDFREQRYKELMQ